MAKEKGGDRGGYFSYYIRTFWILYLKKINIFIMKNTFLYADFSLCLSGFKIHFALFIQALT